MPIPPFMVGVALGITAKFADGREILYYLPILADIMGRFGIWVWVAALIAVRSKTPFLAVVPAKKRVFGLLYGFVLSVLLVWLVQAGIVVNLYEQMLNV